MGKVIAILTRSIIACIVLSGCTPQKRLNDGKACETGPGKTVASLPSEPPKVTLFGVTSEARHVVYVCDRSGSVAVVFDEVQQELIKSIAKLQLRQDFTILMMGNDKSIDLDGNGLLSGDMQNKLNAVRFLKDATAGGVTTALHSLKRAFEILKATDKNKSRKAIYILTDGDFGSFSTSGSYTTRNGTVLNGNEAVIQYLRDHNADKDVQVNTILLYSCDRLANKVMKQIAAENGGQFHLISEDE